MTTRMDQIREIADTKSCAEMPPGRSPGGSSRWLTYGANRFQLWLYRE